MADFSNLTPLLNNIVKNGPSGCAMSVSLEDNTEYEKYLGYGNLEKKLPINKDTIYRVYSLSKVVTSVALMMLYEKGLFLLDDPLEDYLPEFKNMNVIKYKENNEMYLAPAKNKITIKDMLCMTSGIPYPGDSMEAGNYVDVAIKKLKSGGSPTVRAFSKAISNTPLAFEPGSHWKYGVTYEILGALIEELSGKTFGQHLKENIFEPLNMNDTSFKITQENMDSLAVWYEKSSEGNMTPKNNEDDYLQPISNFEGGGGGLLSTLNDITKFGKALACAGALNGNRLISEKTLHLIASDHLNDIQRKDFAHGHLKGYGYGLGVRVMLSPQQAGSNSSIGEYGWSGYPGTWLLVDPKEKLSAVYMQQMLPSFEHIYHPRLRAVIYGSL